MGGRGASSGGSAGGGRVTKQTNTLARGLKSTTYGLTGVKDAELQVVTRIDGYRSVATFSIPAGSTGKGFGQRLMLSALNDGSLLHKGAGDIGNNFTDAAYRVRQALINKGLARVVTDRYGVQILVRIRK